MENGEALANFNSHTREGVTCKVKEKVRRWKISTHTPVRVWLGKTTLCNKISDFNSHTREGVTRYQKYCRGKSCKFQLTHPWGCDQTRILMQKDSLYFNSHTREGVTETANDEQFKKFISTHTPVRVWRLYLLQFINIYGFQLTHPWGCDVQVLTCINVWKISTHTPVRVWRLRKCMQLWTR